MSKTERNLQQQKAYAYLVVSRAKAAGKLVPQPCEVCGKEPTDAHHEDYYKPLEVTWLCRRHHNHNHRHLHYPNRRTTTKRMGKTKGKKLLTPRQVADLLQVKPRTITRWCREGRIQPCRKLGRVWRIEEDFVVTD